VIRTNMSITGRAFGGYYNATKRGRAVNGIERPIKK